MNRLNVFILAAGPGERLKPITDHIPKPLIPILGKPVLQIVLERVSILPCNKIGINLHHRRAAIENWVLQSEFADKIELFPEEPLLGTGGALHNAGALLQDGIFLVHNADILSDIALEKIIEAHLSSENFVTLAVHDYPRFNTVAVDEKGFLLGVGRKNIVPLQSARWLAFTGIAVYSSDFLTFLYHGALSVVDAWSKTLSAGHKIGTFDVTGCYWSDIGRPASYARAVIDQLRDNGETIYIAPSVEKCENVALDGYVVIENNNLLDQGISLNNSIVLPGSHVIGDSNYTNCVLGPGFKINLSESEMVGSSDIPGAFLIGTGGSDRKYYRLRRDDTPAVLMQCTAEDPDFERHIEYTKFYKKHSVPVPELIDIDFERMSALFEDLGDLSLYSWLKCKRGIGQVEQMYKQVLDMLISIHSGMYQHSAECPMLHKRLFDYEHLRWETSYFFENFVEGCMSMRIDNLSALHDEFHRLALLVDSFPKTVVHRDFQSQNIMITNGMPRLLDYQGTRIGPSAYDLASILWDPYYRLDDSLRERLFNYYISQMEITPHHPAFNKSLRDTLLPCRLQRHMQALGAYGFLSLKKGKRYFLKYVPEGLRLLKEDASLSQDSYPVLYDIVMTI
jgi:NDP-sugar pyrophosphorylase family protein/aminoglycoside/choline kinase family phosphotransferase